MKKKYPIGLFVIGIFTNAIFHCFWMFLPGVVLSLIGIFASACLPVGLAILLVDLIVSVAEQLKIRKAFLEESDSSDFRLFQEALSKDGDWKENITQFVNQKISDAASKTDSDDEPNGE